MYASFAMIEKENVLVFFLSCGLVVLENGRLIVVHQRNTLADSNDDQTVC
jgi:hypothetical protein